MFIFAHAPYIDYVPPRLSIGKDWVVVYWVKDPSTGRLKRIRTKVNHIKPVAARRKAAAQMMAAIQSKLAIGWNPLVEKIAPRAGTEAFAAYDRFLTVKSKEMELQSVHSYRSFINVLIQWLRTYGFDEHTTITCVTHEVALAFMDSLEENSGISARTYNNYLSFMLALHGWLMDRGYISENPFSRIKRKSRHLIQKSRRVLTDEELQRLFSWLSKNNPEYLCACLLCYCCCIRPKEIALLKCKDIDLERQVVFVSGKIAKNDKDSFRTIPDQAVPYFRRLELSHPDWAVFGDQSGSADFHSGPKHLNQKKFSDFWIHGVRPKMGWGLDLKFYSLKDTGLTNMAAANLPPLLLKQQADHGSLAITSVYIGTKASANEQLKKADILPKF
ncbi:MAG: tyrosine-type recombinase/integrase [Bacteroidales bacterium]|nr:tyrosine-type recombinase/integrase [Bacteroidales bacterium]